MPRSARIMSATGIYHIMLRGINKQTIFEDDEDKEKFMQTLSHYKVICGYDLYAYCLMNNHVHLLLKTKKQSLETIMKRIGASYVYWYNSKYGRIGHLFQDRFKSEPVEDDAYFLTVLRYIHQNPLKAGLVIDIADYKWSSYNDYVTDTNICDTDFAHSLLNIEKSKAKELFIQYSKKPINDKCLDIEEKIKITDVIARAIINNRCRVRNPINLQKFSVEQRNMLLHVLKEQDRLSIRQIERLTGINRGLVQKA
jgi:putative transposase